MNIRQVMAECDCQHEACAARQYCMASRIEALELEIQGARAEARQAIADAYRMGHEAQSAAIDAALAELDTSPIMNARICEAKRLLRGARETTK